MMLFWWDVWWIVIFDVVGIGNVGVEIFESVFLLLKFKDEDNINFCFVDFVLSMIMFWMV